MNPIGTLSGWMGGQAGGPAGVGTFNGNVSGDLSPGNPNFTPVPGQPGHYYDTASGQIVSQDPISGAMTVSAAPNANQLTAAQQGQTLALQQQQANTLGSIGSNLSAESGAAQDYTNTVNGVGPSAARSQLSTAQDAATGQQLALAAGANGENNPAAMRTAAQNIAGAQSAASGQAALLRANEVTAAEAGRANVLGAQGNQLGSLYGTQGAQAVGYTNAATTNQGNITNATEKNNEFNATQNSNLLGNLGGGLTSLGGML